MNNVYVIDNFTTVWCRWGPITALAAYDVDTSIDIDVRSLKGKVLLIKNTGAAQMTYDILASIDDGVEFDIIHKGATTVAAAAQSLVEFENHYTNIRIEVSGVGAIAVVKFAGSAV